MRTPSDACNTTDVHHFFSEASLNLGGLDLSLDIPKTSLEKNEAATSDEKTHGQLGTHREPCQETDLERRKKKVLLDETLHMAWHGTLDENHAAENNLSFRRFWVKEALSFIKNISDEKCYLYRSTRLNASFVSTILG